MIARRWIVPIAIAVAVVQIGFLSWMIASRASVLRSGQEVMLSVRPVDPRDLLRGDYVILSYDISSISSDLLEQRPPEDMIVEPRTVFVRLRAGDDGLWTPVAARFDEVPAGVREEGDVDIRGVSPIWYQSDTIFSVNYGIERFYVPEGEGLEIERNMNIRPFRVKIAVAADGTAQIKAFYDGETLLYDEPLY